MSASDDSYHLIHISLEYVTPIISAADNGYHRMHLSLQYVAPMMRASDNSWHLVHFLWLESCIPRSSASDDGFHRICLFIHLIYYRNLCTIVAYWYLTGRQYSGNLFNSLVVFLRLACTRRDTNDPVVYLIYYWIRMVIGVHLECNMWTGSQRINKYAKPDSHRLRWSKGFPKAKLVQGARIVHFLLIHLFIYFVDCLRCCRILARSRGRGPQWFI